MLVGRQTELARLQQLLAEGHPVVVYGEAGVGKTALARSAAAEAGIRLVEAGALATLSWLPYLPLRRALGHEPRGADPAYVARELIEAASGAMLLFDDLHWADPQTRATIPFLVGKLPLVVTARTAEPSTVSLADELRAAAFEIVDLEPLVPADAVALVRRLRPEVTPAAAERIATRAGGNPLLLEELSVSGEPSESLELALAARLRALAPESRETLEPWRCSAGRSTKPTFPIPRSSCKRGFSCSSTGLSRSATRCSPRLQQPGSTRNDRRAAPYSRLAGLVVRAGEAARHHLAAGERDLAYDRALEAAEQAEPPGELAAHLEVAASCARGAQADALRLRAAALLVEVGSFAAACAAA